MKKFLLFFIAVAILAASSANAQYFQHLYGVPGDINILGSGINTIGVGPGHFMVGMQGLITRNLIASRTDANGDVPGAPYFNQEYSLFTSAGNGANVSDVRTVELPDSRGFAVAGDYVEQRTGRWNIFYTIIDPTGTITSPISTYIPVSTPPANYQISSVGAIALSADGRYLYITGSVGDPTAGNSLYIYAIKIDLSGNIQWAHVYNFDNPPGNPDPNARHIAKDIIESPYAPEVIVVGQTSRSDFNPDGFFFRMDSATGAALSVGQLYGTAASSDFFNSISVANNPLPSAIPPSPRNPIGYPGGPGFIIGGGSNANGTMDHWLMKVDPAGGTIWSRLYNYNGTPGSYNLCNDAIERLSPMSGLYEYYALGTTSNGNMGGNDMVVIKTDAMGTTAAQFTYGDANADYGVSIAQNNSGTGDGLSLYGNKLYGASSDMYLVKAYFSGQSGCDEDINITTSPNGPDMYSWMMPRYITEFTTDTMSETDTPASDVTICFNTTVFGGMNTLVAPGRTDDSRVSVIAVPNANVQNLEELHLSVESDIAADAQASIYDMVGRMVGSSAFSLVKGKNTLSFDISRMSLMPGVYNVIIKGAGKDMHTLFVVK